MDEVLKNVLGEEIYSEKGSTLKKELAKEVIPKSEFNAKLDLIKDLQSDKTALLSDKEELQKKIDESKNANMSELEKLQENFQKLSEKLENESKARSESETALQKERRTNSLKSKLSEAKLKNKFMDFAVPKFMDVEDQEFEDKLKEFADNYKEMFGDDKVAGKQPEGSFNENTEGQPKEYKTFAEWKADMKNN